MPTESAARPLHHSLLRAVFGLKEASDRELLSRFVCSRDEDAFAEIVRRHGRMVLAVSRRVAGHAQDAEDAFQAAFLVLARRAMQIQRPEQLANWLYGVAYRTALEARAARRRVLERPVSASNSEPPAPTPPDDPSELRQAIDEELSKLPDKYRTAVVLCDLEGLPRSLAASRLKIPEGTLSSRLAYARKTLATRLTRRGISTTAGAIAVALSREALGSTACRNLVLATARAAVCIAKGGTLTSDVVSQSVTLLTDGVIKAMFVSRLRLALSLLLASGLAGIGAFSIAQVPGQSSLPQPERARVVPGQVVFDPVEDHFASHQPKVEKVAPKGIEDDDVPLTASPNQAVVRVEDGKLVVRQRGQHVAQVAMTAASGQQVMSYQRKSGVHASTYDPADVAVFDMKGNRLQPKAWKDKLKNDVHALVAFDGRLPNPRELGLFKDDTLIVVLPAGSGGAATYTDSLIPTPSIPGVPTRPGTSAGTPVAPAVAPSSVPAPTRPAPPRTTPPQPPPSGAFSAGF